MKRLAACALLLVACGDDSGGAGGGDTTTLVGAFDGLFDDVVTGYNFPLDIAIFPGPFEPGPEPPVGDLLAADYGTSSILRAPNPTGESGVAAEMFYDGSEAGLRGATAVSIAPDGLVWVSFEQGGANDRGAIAVLSSSGEELTLIDSLLEPDAFEHPAGICYGGEGEPEGSAFFFFVNLGDGSAWRISASSTSGDDPLIEQVGSGLATGSAGNPGPPAINNGNDLPQDGARGCAYADGRLYVADAQNGRIARFDGADVDLDVTPVALEDTPAELVTYPTDVAVNAEGALIVISYDNAHAFASLALPSGGFIDNGLHDLNVNAGNYGVALAADTIWFTRANNQNGSVRAITPSQAHPPSTEGPVPAQ